MRFSLGFISSLLFTTSVVTAAPLAIRQTGKGTPSANDKLVLTFAGVLERLETEFYKQALAKFSDADFTAAGFGDINIPKTLFSVIVGDEEAHALALDKALVALGGSPVTTCQFDFSSVLGDVKTMAGVARLIEEVGVSAYMGAAPLMDDKELLTAAAGILTIEARHQTALNLLNGATPIPQPFDMSLSPSQVLALAGPFISGCDLGIPANPPLTVTNTGSVGVGTKLELSSPGITADLDRSTATCQMLVGGSATALALPLDNCVVPSGIEGPVYLFVANTTAPLLNSRVNQFESSIIAGPTGLFLDNFSDPAAAAIVGGSAGSGGSTPPPADVGAEFTSTFATSTTITPAEATQVAELNGGNDTLGSDSNPETPPPATSSGPEVVGWSGTTTPAGP